MAKVPPHNCDCIGISTLSSLTDTTVKTVKNESHIESELMIKVLTTNLPRTATPLHTCVRHPQTQQYCNPDSTREMRLGTGTFESTCQGPMGTGQGKQTRNHGMARIAQAKGGPRNYLDDLRLQ